MEKTYKLYRDDWLLSKIASSFGYNAYNGEPDLIEKVKLESKGMFLKLILIIILSITIVPFIFFSLMSLFSTFFSANLIFVFVPIFITLLSIFMIISFVNHQNVKKTFIRTESVANVPNTSEKVDFIRLTNENLAINMFNRSDVFINFPIKNIKNIYFMYGDLTLFHKHRYQFSDMDELLVSSRFKPLGYDRNRNSGSNAYVMIEGKPTYVHQHKGKLQIDKLKRYYRKYFHIDIDGNVENDGYFLFIFTKDYEYHILYLPQSILSQGFIHDLEYVLQKETGNVIKTPYTYEEFYGKKPIQILSSDYDSDLESLIPLREKLAALKKAE